MFLSFARFLIFSKIHADFASFRPAKIVRDRRQVGQRLSGRETTMAPEIFRFRSAAAGV